MTITAAPEDVRREIMLEWADWLESDRFVQGQVVLHRAVRDGRDKFCVLGVLCEVLVARGILDRVDPPNGSGIFKYRASSPEDGLSLHFMELPHAAAQYLGWPDGRGFVPGAYGGRYRLVWGDFNDRGGTFSEAAQIIRESVNS